MATERVRVHFAIDFGSRRVEKALVVVQPTFEALRSAALKRFPRELRKRRGWTMYVQEPSGVRELTEGAELAGLLRNDCTVVVAEAMPPLLGEAMPSRSQQSPGAGPAPAAEADAQHDGAEGQADAACAQSCGGEAEPRAEECGAVAAAGERKEARRGARAAGGRAGGAGGQEAGWSCRALQAGGDCRPLRWEYLLKDQDRRARRGVARLLRHHFAEERLDSWLDELAGFVRRWHGVGAAEEAAARNGKARPRRSVFFSHCGCVYRHSARDFPGEPYPDVLLEIQEALLAPLGLAADEVPDSCWANLYEDGGTALGWHADDEKIFDFKDDGCLIISFSLGATRKFQLKLKEGDGRVVAEAGLGHGDLCTMEDLTQQYYVHRVPPEGVEAPRINLTFRWIARHNCPCEGKERRRRRPVALDERMMRGGFQGSPASVASSEEEMGDHEEEEEEEGEQEQEQEVEEEEQQQQQQEEQEEEEQEMASRAEGGLGDAAPARGEA